MLRYGMIYILDAYNVIHKIRRLEAALNKDLRSSRDALVTLCAQFASSRGGVSEIILVFDGKSEFQDLSQANPPKVRLIFSETGEDADERIITVLDQLSGENNKCVVSDDNFVKNHARAYKTRSISVREFEALVDTKNKQQRNRGELSRNDALSPKTAAEITSAYKKELGLS